MNQNSSTNLLKRRAFQLIFLFGMISMLGDISYEGARSINGAYLKLLNADPIIVGFIFGIGEFLGYGIRLFSGFISDKTQSYWFFTILGYSLIISVPLLSFSNSWQIAVLLMILERIGKGIRSPAKDTIVSFASKQVGTGLGFGITELIDQVGAFLGPLIFTLFFLSIKSKVELIHYQKAYELSWIPFFILILILIFAFIKFSNPIEFENTKKLKFNLYSSKVFWFYLLFIFFTTLGFINFGIIGYHLKAKEFVNDFQIPLLYGIAMFFDAITGIIVGKIYDNIKNKNNQNYSETKILVFIPIFTLIGIVLLFAENLFFVYLGVIFWGIVMGFHETIMKAIISDLTDINQRGMGFGIFHIVYGFSFLIGSTLTGYMYKISISWLLFLVFFFEALSLLIFLILKKSLNKV